MKSDTQKNKNQIVKNLKGKVETKNGPIYWQYDEQAPMTLQGFLPFFSQYLETSGIFESWIKDCPLNYTSNNAPDKKDVLGTALLSVLSGHTRYAHISSLYGDSVAAEILGINKIVSHDSLMRGLAKLEETEANNENLLFPIVINKIPRNEYQILITNLDYSMPAIAQLYRDRGDCENIFDELKNNWGWGGFTTEDIKRTRIMAQLTALVYNWWNIFCRLADPDKHMEAKTSRPLLQNIIGKMVKTGGKRLMRLASTGAEASKAMEFFNKICKLLNKINATATQLTEELKWPLILGIAFKRYLNNQQLKAIFCGNQYLLSVLFD